MFIVSMLLILIMRVSICISRLPSSILGSGALALSYGSGIWIKEHNFSSDPSGHSFFPLHRFLMSTQIPESHVNYKGKSHTEIESG